MTKFQNPAAQKKYDAAVRAIAELAVADARAFLAECQRDAEADGEEPPGADHINEQLEMTLEFYNLEGDVLEAAKKLATLRPEACPGCGRTPGEGYDENCEHPDGCGFFKSMDPDLNQVHERR